MKQIHTFICIPSPVQGLSLTPDDAWSVHSLAHVYEMRAEVDKGLKFMEGREKDWQVPVFVCNDEARPSNPVHSFKFTNSNMHCLIPGIRRPGQSQLLALGSLLHREGKDHNGFSQSSEELAVGVFVELTISSPSGNLKSAVDYIGRLICVCICATRSVTRACLSGLKSFQIPPSNLLFLLSPPLPPLPPLPPFTSSHILFLLFLLSPPLPPLTSSHLLSPPLPPLTSSSSFHLLSPSLPPLTSSHLLFLLFLLSPPLPPLTSSSSSSSSHLLSPPLTSSSSSHLLSPPLPPLPPLTSSSSSSSSHLLFLHLSGSSVLLSPPLTSSSSSSSSHLLFLLLHRSSTKPRCRSTTLRSVCVEGLHLKTLMVYLSWVHSGFSSHVPILGGSALKAMCCSGDPRGQVWTNGSQTTHRPFQCQPPKRMIFLFTLKIREATWEWSSLMSFDVLHTRHENISWCHSGPTWVWAQQKFLRKVRWYSWMFNGSRPGNPAKTWRCLWLCPLNVSFCGGGC